MKAALSCSDVSTRETVIAMEMRLRYMETFSQRCRGLIGREETFLAADEAIMFKNCRSIHTFGMKRCIDVAFFDVAGRVCRSFRALPPGKMVFCRQAVSVCERFASPTPWPAEDHLARLLKRGPDVSLYEIERSGR
jgi:uncharacterized protein